jgi:N-acetylglucosamine kinase-like BadF-type ATPase
MGKNIFFIGIDSGGTKSEVLIKNADNKTLYKKTHKAIHYSTHGKDKLVKHLNDIITCSVKIKKLSPKNCGGICIGLAGVREEKDRKILKKHLINSLEFKNILIVPDTIITLYGAFECNDGIILICGTGSILFGFVNGEFIRIGGWGRIIGDYGSGYEIGKAAIKHLVAEYDSRKKIGKLSQAIEKRFSFDKKNILENIYRDNFDLQHLVPLILEYAEKKDKDALKIIDKTSDELINHIEKFFSITNPDKKINLVLSGSVIENENILSSKLKRKIKKDFKNINIVNKIHSPSEGAILLAKNIFYKN